MFETLHFYLESTIILGDQSGPQLGPEKFSMRTIRNVLQWTRDASLIVVQNSSLREQRRGEIWRKDKTRMHELRETKRVSTAAKYRCASFRARVFRNAIHGEKNKQKKKRRKREARSFSPQSRLTFLFYSVTGREFQNASPGPPLWKWISRTATPVHRPRRSIFARQLEKRREDVWKGAPVRFQILSSPSL